MSTETPTQSPIRLAVIIGSVRHERFADAITGWLQAELATIDGVEVDTIDLADIDLPLQGTRPGGTETVISDRLRDADAFLVVTPEYNHSFPAALKNAIDWHFTEWAYKPVAFVGYGAGSGGIRAIEQLRLIFPELRATTVRDAVLLNAPWTRLGPNGYEGTEGERAALTATMTELGWWARTLRAGRVAVQVSAA
ncbi:NADPH-dependent FMN reductase [Amycolatopsis keratiniphila]|uniref:NADPH-dependent FMN reductase n=1 Tax=Amycolatopsis keratiniphila TaxID=129921 RepID=UPI00087C3F71|nr:NAD(P)H-dependent oxidoreductase [Amycolatopsis keratiniphila]OLZ61522.1 NADPH-dependent FMN reductase [Amycolatopsis keratiniphila subsp. nogabecina]SDU19100.1 NAD(P)H-dependent FMN reductase [Amycolatopsis keratiniphila]